MILYRGTWSRESKPRPREYACVFFTPYFSEAISYAAGEDSGHERGWGYVQKYRLPRHRLLDRYAPDGDRMNPVARALLSEHFGGEWHDEDSLEVFWDPPSRWLSFLAERGYTGTKTGSSICLFDTAEAELLERWKVWWDDKTRGWKTKKA